MQLMDLFKTNQPSESEIQQQIHYQMLIVFKSFFSMLSGDNSLESVGKMTYALVETPAFALAAQYPD